MSNQPDFEALPFLSIDEQPISWQQALGYLWLFGQLRPMIQTIVSQHVIYQEIKQREDLEVSPSEFEQAVIDFRLQQKLTTSQQFQQWLNREGLDYPAFQNRIVLNLKLDKLASKIAEPKLDDYFEKNKKFLDQIELSCFIVPEQILAQTFKNQLLEQQKSFERLAQDYSDAPEHNVIVTRRLARRQQWPKEIQNSLETAEIGDIIGPTFFEDRWCVFQIQKIVPPVLEDQLKRALEGQLFKEWLAQSINKLQVQLVSQQGEKPPLEA